MSRAARLARQRWATARTALFPLAAILAIPVRAERLPQSAVGPADTTLTARPSRGSRARSVEDVGSLPGIFTENAAHIQRAGG